MPAGRTITEHEIRAQKKRKENHCQKDDIAYVW
jgi:hypothetical protein